MEQAPHFGAIPSAGDVQKKKAQQVTDAEWREQFVEELCQPDALLRLQRLEQNDSAKADKVKAELFRMASRTGAGKAAKDTPFSDATEIAPGSIAPGSVKKGSVTDAQLAALIEGMSQTESAPSSVISDSRGLVLDRRRINDDSDSDIDLSDL